MVMKGSWKCSPLAGKMLKSKALLEKPSLLAASRSVLPRPMVRAAASLVRSSSSMSRMRWVVVVVVVVVPIGGCRGSHGQQARGGCSVSMSPAD